MQVQDRFFDSSLGSIEETSVFRGISIISFEFCSLVVEYLGPGCYEPQKSRDSLLNSRNIASASFRYVRSKS